MNVMESIYRRFAGEADRQIADHLMANPQEWAPDRGAYYLENRNRSLRIWIANSDYGIKVYFGGGFAERSFKPGWAGRRLIWRAVQRMNVPSTRQMEAIIADTVVRSLLQDDGSSRP